MVVRLGDATVLVFDHEGRVEHRPEALVDEHLQRDPAVGEQRRRHARGDGGCVDRGAGLEVVELHLAFGEPEERPAPWVANVRRLAGS